MKNNIGSRRGNVGLAHLGKPIFGVGINDSDFVCHSISNTGKVISCVFYSRWKSMLQRCYDKKHLERNPCYVGCSVANEWLLFTNFKKWMEKQNYSDGRQLDKDILCPGNKEYGPAVCLFVPAKINSIMGSHEKSRGNYPLGVYRHKFSGLFNARIKKGDRVHSLGYFKCQNKAHEVYLLEKSKFLIETADLLGPTEDPRIAPALRAMAQNLLKSII